MIKLTIEGDVYNKFECALEDSYRANDLLKMLSSIPTNETYSVKSIKVKTDVNLVGKEYDVCDNSYCINLSNGKDAWLVQKESAYYSPDKGEKDARFFIVKEPYIEKINVRPFGDFYVIFVNVVSTKTGNIYRVTYNEGCVWYGNCSMLF